MFFALSLAETLHCQTHKPSIKSFLQKLALIFKPANEKGSLCQKWSLFKMIWQKIKWNMSIAIFTLGVRKRSEEQSYHRKLSIFCTLRPLMVNDIHRNTCYYAKKQLFGNTLTMFKDLSLFLYGEKYQYSIRNLFLASENKQSKTFWQKTDRNAFEI